MMSSTLSKIHVNNSTGLSLNERFTAISTKPKVVTNIGTGRRSRSRSVQRQVPVTAAPEHLTSRANQRLLAQLQRKHKVQAALKLKRRSMRTVGGGGGGGFYGNGSNGRIQRGSVKAFRVGANGKTIRTNSLARVATMKADKESLNNRGRPLRRSNSSGNIANRLGPRRPTVGGAAQRVARRNLDRQRRRNSSGGAAVGAISGRGRYAGNSNRGRSRSRSRSRTRTQSGGNLRNRSRTRNAFGGNQLNNNRSRSRNRYRNDNIANAPSVNTPIRGRSRSRSRGRPDPVNRSNLPIKARLGVRPGAAAAANRVPNNRRRNASISRRGVQTGRVQKRRNSTNANTAAGSSNSGRGRNRSRSATRAARNGNVRSASRTRKGQVGQQRQQGEQGQRNSRAPRGRSLQRRGSNTNNNNNSNNGQRGPNYKGKPQTQQRRGRSRTGRGSNSGAGSRNQGNKTNAAATPSVNKDDLDKELDQYMATTKTENELDYLLKN